jgi:hypothetical protein
MENKRYEQVISFARLHDNKYSAFVLARDYESFLKLARRLAAIDVHRCNGTKYTTDESYEKAIRKVYDKLDELCGSPFGLCYFHQSDPRGASLYIGRPEAELSFDNYTNGLAIF